MQGANIKYLNVSHFLFLVVYMYKSILIFVATFINFSNPRTINQNNNIWQSPLDSKTFVRFLLLGISADKIWLTTRHSVGQGHIGNNPFQTTFLDFAWSCGQNVIFGLIYSDKVVQFTQEVSYPGITRQKNKLLCRFYDRPLTTTQRQPKKVTQTVTWNP